MAKKKTDDKEVIIKENGKVKKHIKISHRFISVLSVVSILGFIGIVTENLFNLNLHYYIESLWMVIVGLGLIWEARIKKLKEISKKGLNSNNFTNLITSIIGVIALIAGIFSFPGIRIEIVAFLRE